MNGSGKGEIPTTTVVIHGTEFVAYSERLEAFTGLMLTAAAEADTHQPDKWGPGVDSTAVLGMSHIFQHIPQKFPVEYILLWLRYYICPELSLDTVEGGLILYMSRVNSHALS